jgi:hypothetical protein
VAGCIPAHKAIRSIHAFSSGAFFGAIRKIKHPNLWDVKHKPPPCANGPPTESFIIYDESSSPCADDYIIDADYPIDLSQRSSKNEDGNLPEKIQPRAHWLSTPEFAEMLNSSLKNRY